MDARTLIREMEADIQATENKGITEIQLKNFKAYLEELKEIVKDQEEKEALQQENTERELKEQKKEILDSQIKIISALYEKANAYTNLIIMAGYAGFFGLWSVTKDNLIPKQVLWSALFMLISGSSFVIFETVRMIVNACFVFSINNPLKRLSGAQNMDEIINIYKEHEKRTNSRNVKFYYFWVFALIIIIPTALIGASILMYSFIVKLLALYNYC